MQGRNFVRKQEISHKHFKFSDTWQLLCLGRIWILEYFSHVKVKFDRVKVQFGHVKVKFAKVNVKFWKVNAKFGRSKEYCVTLSVC